MKKLKIYFRTYVRQHLNASDYFDGIKRKYGSELRYLPPSNIYIKVDDSEIEDLKKEGIIVTSYSQETCKMVVQMVAEISVQSEDEAGEILANMNDYVFAEYVRDYRVDRGPK